ncbi:MAG: MFS transporter [Syntrophobacteraceae bacterium]
MSEKVGVPQSDTPPKKEHVKVVITAVLGNTLEWYDFFLYGTAAALVFNKLFFPELSPLVGTVAAFATFAVGFLARPVGGILFGHFGDRIGRKQMLYLALVVMGIGTTVIGLLPTFGTIGIWAPIVLVTCRVVQGLGLGGSWGGAVLMAVEYAPENKRGFYGALVQLGVPLGLVLGTLVFGFFARLPEQQFLSWGWRIPFLFSVLLVVVAIFILVKISETPVFEKIKVAHKEARIPIIEAIIKHPKNLLLAMGVRFAENGLFYIYAAFVFAYATNILKISRATILDAVTIAAFVEAVTIPLFGILSDKIGRRPVYMFGAVFSGLWSFPFFWIIGYGGLWAVTLGVAVGLGIGHAAMYAPQASFLSEMFSARVRYSGASLGYQLASIFAGALTPLVATSLLAWYSSAYWPIGIYMMILALITVVSLYLAAETYKQSLEETYDEVAVPKKA